MIKAVKIVLFFLLCGMVLKISDRILQNKTEEPYRNLHSLEDNTVDVLVLGNSHAHNGLYTNVFWSKYGMAAYILSGSMQTIWDSYYALQDALVTQTPKLVILEGYSLCTDHEYVSRSFVDINTRGLRWSKNKLDAVNAAAPKTEVAGHILAYPVYHNRYNKITREDFMLYHADENNKGTHFVPYETAFDPPQEPADAQPGPITNKVETYYRKIMTLCRERGISFLVVTAPFRYTTEEYQQLLTGKIIADEYDVPFVNCNDFTDEIGIDYACSTSDGTHLNYHGGPLFSGFIADYITEHYDIPDRRSEAAGRYASWQKDADVLARRLYNRNARNAEDLVSFFNLFTDTSYIKVVMFGGACTDDEPELRTYMGALGIEPCGKGGIRVVCGSDVPVTCLPGEEQYYAVGKRSFYFASRFDGSIEGIANTVLLDLEAVPENPEPNGMTVMVYDTVLQEPVIAAVTWKTNGYQGYEWLD